MEKSKQKLNLKPDENQKGIWRFSPLLEPIDKSFRLSLGEGNTEEFSLDENIILKREDKNPTGSLKDRGMAYLVSLAYGLGAKDLVLSSSGNAAISALSYCKLAGLNLHIFVSKKTSTGKMKKIDELDGTVTVSENAVSESFRFAKKNNFFNLRPSVNEFGHEGYKTIAYELLLAREKIDDIFIPVSSGVCLVGVFEGFNRFLKLPRIHLCQPSANALLSFLYDNDFVKEEKSLASSLVAKTHPLREKILEAVAKTNGTGWTIGNTEILAAQSKLEERKIVTSNEGALALAAVYKAREKGWKLGRTVVLLTGKKY